MSEARQFIPVRIAVLTVSDTRTLETDVSGQTLADRVAEAGHLLSARKIVKDDIRAIRHVIRDWANRSDVDAMITTGGTGLTGRDVTIEAVRPLFAGEVAPQVVRSGAGYHVLKLIERKDADLRIVQQHARHGVARPQPPPEQEGRLKAVPRC